jgi:SulP family sulfate permease
MSRDRRWGEFPRPHLGDLIAGLSVAPVLIPQSIAFARLAGLPAEHGLYAAMLPPIAAALLASSPYLQTGPVAMTSLLTFGVLSVVAPPDTAGYVALAALLALTVGVVRVVIGLVRWGWVAYLMSQPVMSGFTNAAAILIIAAQLPPLLGVPGTGGGLLSGAGFALAHPGQWNPAAMGLSAASFLIVFAGRRIHALFPGVLLVVVVGLAWTGLLGYDGPLVGHIPAGLPPFSLALPWAALPSLLVPAIIIALVGFAEPAAIARMYAEQDRRPWSPDREFVSQGVANLAAGASGGFPVGGSFSRTAITRMAGGRTRWSGAVAGLVTLAVLPFADVLATLPQAVIAAVIVVSVLRMIDLVSLARLRHYSLPQAGIGWLTFGLTLVLAPRVDEAVLVGVGVAGAVHIWRELRVHVRTTFSNSTLRLAPQGVLFFGSAPALETALVDALAQHPTARHLVLDLEALGRIDYTGGLALRSVVREAERAGLVVEVCGVAPQAERVLRRLLGPDAIEQRGGHGRSQAVTGGHGG